MTLLHLASRSGEEMAQQPRKRKPNRDILEFVERLRRAMAAKGYRPDERGEQTRLARASGVHQAQINRALSAQRFPSRAVIAKIALALDVHPGWLAYGGDDLLPPVPGIKPGAATLEHLAELIAAHLQKRGDSG